jgi:hypothetical protein
MRMVGDKDGTKGKDITALDLDTVQSVINLIRMEWLHQMRRLALDVYRERFAPNRSILDSLPSEGDFRLEDIRKLRFWYDEFSSAYEELSVQKGEENTDRGRNGVS